MTKMTAVIPARAGSRRLPNKNVALFQGVSLLARKIRQLRQTAGVDRVVVSSDSEEYLALAVLEGAEPHRRAPEFCDEVSQPFGAVVRNVCESLDSGHVLWAPCTSPLVGPNLYDEAIAVYYSEIRDGYDSLMSVQPFRRYVWDVHGPINYELGLKHVPSQRLPELYFVADAIQIAPRTKMIEWSYFHGPNPFRFILDRRSAVDIDDELDLKVALAYAE